MGPERPADYTTPSKSTETHHMVFEKQLMALEKPLMILGKHCLVLEKFHMVRENVHTQTCAYQDVHRNSYHVHTHTSVARWLKSGGSRHDSLPSELFLGGRLISTSRMDSELSQARIEEAMKSKPCVVFQVSVQKDSQGIGCKRFQY